MDLLLQLVANQIGVVVDRPAVQETTALGAAYLAGLAAGVWSTTGDLWAREREFAPNADRTAADAAYREWLRAVARARVWAAG